MANLPKHVSRKLGPNRNETARRPRRRDRNFAQSRDIHEDRGERQIKMDQRHQNLAATLRSK